MTAAVEFPFTTEDAIRRARIDADMTPQELAAAIPVNYQTVLRWETGMKVPSGRNLIRLIAITNADWLPAALENARKRSRCSDEYAGHELAMTAA